MKIVATAGKDDIAKVYIAKTDRGEYIEFSDSLTPPMPIEKKWILTVSTLFGCPVACAFCDAGSAYHGKLSKEEILEQIDYLINTRFPDKQIPTEKFKIQFARMGDPAFNMNVLDALEEIPTLYDAPGLVPSISTIAPASCEDFFERLLTVRGKFDKNQFQMQFSIHTTDEASRDKLIPVKKWSFDRIAEYGESFFIEGGKKITLNFALAKGMPVDPEILLRHFDPDKYLLKITPVNPTYKAVENDISSYIVKDRTRYEISDACINAGYEVIISIGGKNENLIGSNCGQHLNNYLKEEASIEEGYVYPLMYI